MKLEYRMTRQSSNEPRVVETDGSSWAVRLPMGDGWELDKVVTDSHNHVLFIWVRPTGDR